MVDDIKESFETRIHSLILRIKEISSKDEYEEISSDLSRYLCLLISGYFEQVFRNVLKDYIQKQSNESIKNFVSKEVLDKTNNFNTKKIKRYIKDFNSGWYDEIKSIACFDEYSESLDYIYTNRNKIAHGSDVTVVYRDLELHYERIKNFLNKVIEFFIKH